MNDDNFFSIIRLNLLCLYFKFIKIFPIIISLYSFTVTYSFAETHENINSLIGLATLKEQVRKELQMLNIPNHSWLPQHVISDSIIILDVAIIGGGMNGLATSFALIKEGINNVKVFDENTCGKEGPWARYARMNVLRSGKTDLGPSLGIPSLTFWAWYEVQYGSENWKQLKSIPTHLWNSYLCWFKNVLNLPVENNITLKSILPLNDFFELSFEKQGMEQLVYARKVVLATGRDGAGGKEIPVYMKNIALHLYAHTIEQIDLESLANKKIAIIGAGASAFDAAAAALEHGARSVDIIIRREGLPRANDHLPFNQPGAGLGFYYLSDQERWASFSEWLGHGIPPPKETLHRVENFKNLTVHYSTRVQNISDNGVTARISTSKGDFDVDFIILATGFAVDLSRRPELASFYSEILLWGNRVPSALSTANSKLGRFPYLGPHFEFLAANPGAAKHLKNIYCFNYGAFLSHGLLGGDIGLNSVGAIRVAEGILIDFFLENAKTSLSTSPNLTISPNQNF
ncbi:MAG: NAD(P)/FAD-dependent oxidoreductase [Parachlamydiaceae bacterium]|nr:NAD(P)/FAD-dependent oxidoreductase [Parachlamydiaceae bacterium]